jgi:hypothetical protein
MTRGHVLRDVLSRNLRRLGYALVLAYGVADAVAPRAFLRLKLAPAGLAFENVREIEPRPGYVRGARAAGLGMIVAGATGLALESTASEATEAVGDEESASEE